jgi:hypothetical protein
MVKHHFDILKRTAVLPVLMHHCPTEVREEQNDRLLLCKQHPS